MFCAHTRTLNLSRSLPTLAFLQAVLPAPLAPLDHTPGLQVSMGLS
jgi:hypothetical protein